MGDIVELLGWLAAAGALLALSNFFLKLIGRTWLKGVPERYARQVGAYRGFMRFMVRRHRFFGLGAFVLVLGHASLVILGSALSVTGGIAALVLGATVTLGGYGFYVKKDMRAGWLPLHRACAFLLALALVAHQLFKGFLAL